MSTRYPFNPVPEEPKGWVLVRKKRDWLPEWLWRLIHPLALIHPFTYIMTRRVGALPAKELL